ncbi:MAG: S8 family serine peptidase [Acidobacteriota bacterium]|nr:MAG: S8 family serine peptidase [Acidobacteriota bacterium]
MKRMSGTLTVALLAFLGVAGGGVFTQPPRATMNSRAEFLLLCYEQGSLWDCAPEWAQEGGLRAAVRFREIPSEHALYMLEGEGIRFSLLRHGERRGVEAATSRRSLAARVPWEKVRTLVNHPLVERIEAYWRPLPTLDLSNPEVDASDGAWLYDDDGGLPLRGAGTVIAAIDFGIDVYHPALFKDTGPTYDWLDNGNSIFDRGVDCVDLNTNFLCDADELLDFVDGAGGPSGTMCVFEANIDWLFNDADADAVRDQANDLVTTFGEQLFIVNDANENNALDVGETLQALGESKILRTRNGTGIVRVRGVDLTDTDADTSGHGTAVAGIAVGQAPGRLLAGIAPDAEYLLGDVDGGVLAAAEWAELEGADVVLHEFGEWLYEFLDGSSIYEEQMDAQSAGGITQVTGAGNLANGNKHSQFTVAGGGSVTNTFTVPAGQIEIYASYLWRTPSNNLRMRITPPATPQSGDLPMNPAWTETIVGVYNVSTFKETSPRGTVKVDFWIHDGGNPVTGSWALEIFNDAVSDELVDGYIDDNTRSWSGGTVFTNFVTSARTVTWPATADSAVTVASYSTRGALGVLSSFSGRGTRVDGVSILDVAAPGDNDIYTARSEDQTSPCFTPCLVTCESPCLAIPCPIWGRHKFFTGTSASAPHAAAAAAILKQYIPALPPPQVRTAIQDGALEDANTGATPNDDWGYGKLRILQALKEADRTPPAWDTTVGAQTVVTSCGSATVSWNPATDLYKNPVRYHVYRDAVSGFTPSLANRIATTTLTSYTDSVAAGTYYYIVRAEDSAIEPNEDTNTVEVSAVVPTTVVAYDTSFDPVTTLAEDCGDGDAVVEPGEGWSATVQLENTSVCNATNVLADLTVNAGSAVAATVCNNPGDYGSIPAGGTATFTYSFLVDAGAVCVNDLTFDVTGIVSDEGAYPGEIPAFSLQVGTINPGPTETSFQVADPLGALDSTEFSDFAPAFTIPSPAKSATLSYTLSGATDLVNCVEVALVDPSATATVVKPLGVADENPYDVTGLYTKAGTYQLRLMEEGGGCGGGGKAKVAAGTLSVTAGVVECDASACVCPFPPPPEPSPVGSADPLLVPTTAADQIIVEDVENETGYVVYEGAIGTWYGTPSQTCLDTWNDVGSTVELGYSIVGAGDRWVVVSAANAFSESSCGTDNAGAERNAQPGWPATGPCP